MESAAEGLSKLSMDSKAEDSAEDKYHGRSPQVKRGGFRSLIVAVGLPLVVGLIQGFTSPPDKWYGNLKKPSWNPPGWLFGGIWSVIYPLMGLASWLVWANGGWQKQSKALSIYVLQLSLNFFWTFAFFSLHNPLLALADIALLIAAVVACIVTFKPVNHVAANLMQIYLTWLTFAAALNSSIWYMNTGGGSHERVPESQESTVE